MKLKLILGRAGSGKTSYCLEAVRSELRRSADGKAVFLLLPEHATFKLEKLLAATPDLKGFARAYVFGFKRLAERVLLETGGGLKPRLDEMGKRMLLLQALQRRQKALRCLGRAARQRSFAESLARMIEEFKAYKVAPPELKEAAARLPDSSLKDKLADLSLLYEEFVTMAQARYNDGEDRLDLLAQKIGESTLLRGAQVFLDGFVFFNPQELAILQELLQAADEVQITLCLDEPASPQRASETDVFHRQWKTLQLLRGLAERLGASVEVVELSGTRRFLSSDLRHIEANLYRLPLQKLTADGGVSVVEAATRRLEVESAAADMVRLCREKGYRWRDIGVLVRDGDAYHDVLLEVLRDYEISFFSDAKRLCLHHPLAELIRSSFEAMQGWRYEPLFRMFKTDFFSVSRTQIDVLENYVLAFGIRGKRWTDDDDWTYRRNLSLAEDSADDAPQEEFLAEVNAIRRLLIAPCRQLQMKLQAAENVAAMTRAVYDFLIALGVPERLERWSDALLQQGELAKAREHQQLWDGLMEFMDRMVETCGADKMPIDQYGALFNEGLENMELSLIPPSLDYVTVASFDQNSLDNVKAVYILGAADGVLPQRSRGEGLLTDVERTAMAELGLVMAAGTGADLFAEQFTVYAGLTRATEYLRLSYALSDSDGSALTPSSLVKRIRDMLDQCAFMSIPLDTTSGEKAWKIARPRQAVAHLATVLQSAAAGEAAEGCWRDVYNWALKDAELGAIMQKALSGLFGNKKPLPLPPGLARKLYVKQKRLQGSITRFEKFRACPFQHFAQYGLKLKERAEYRFAAPDLGNFLHAALKRFGDQMAEAGRSWSEVGDSECKDICENIVTELAPRLQNEILLSSAGYRHLLRRIRYTVEQSIRRLVAFSGVSAFQPVGLEKNFGRGEMLPPLTYMLEDDYRLEIRGQIDRIDMFEEDGKCYFLIIDYKSGNAYLNLIDVYYGLKMQLMTYLLAVQNSAQELMGKAAIPAGVLYYFLKNPLLNETHKISEPEVRQKLDAMLKMPGWVLADADLVRRIDSAGRFIKVTLTTKNTIHGASKSSVKTEEEFAALLRHMDVILTDTGRKILHGDISISPYEIGSQQACTYCKYRSICKFDARMPEHNYRKLAKLDSEAIMRELMGM